MSGGTQARLDPARFYSKPGSPSFAFALERAVIADGRFASLSAPAQVALLVLVNRYSDRNGRAKVKQETLAAVLGRTERSVRSAFNACVDSGILSIHGSRRPTDGKRGANVYSINSNLVAQAEETFRSWSEASNRKKPSAGTRPEETFRGTGPEETFLTERSSNGVSNEKNLAEAWAND